MEVARDIFSDVVLTSEGKAPDAIPIFPAPDARGKINARDGRVWSMPSPQAVVESYNSDAQEAPIDFEHSSEIKAPQGEEAPAAGWLKALRLRPDGSIWANVDWTDIGRAAVESRQYRYISPAFRTDPETGEVLQVVSAGLTNRPALTMPALAHDQGNASASQSSTLTAFDYEVAAKCGISREELERSTQPRSDAGLVLLREEDRRACEALGWSSLEYVRFSK